jgi:hypothetical protein
MVRKDSYAGQPCKSCSADSHERLLKLSLPNYNPLPMENEIPANYILISLFPRIIMLGESSDKDS